MTDIDTKDFSIDPADDPRTLRFVKVDPQAARTLHAAQVDRFNTEGFIAGLPVFDPDESDRVAAYFDGLIDAVVEADDRRNSYSINAYQLVCAGIYDLVKTPIVLDYVTDILGEDFVCWGSQLFCKMPGDPMEIPMHQDAIYWPFSSARSVTAWLAIDDADEENAAMTFAPGSHLGGPVAHVEKELDGTRVLKRTVADPQRYPGRVSNDLCRGEMSLHNDLLWHGSPPNRSQRRRAGFTIRYTAADVTVLPGWEDWYIPVVHCRGTIPGHWPDRRRPDGEHPEKMAGWSGTFDGNIPDAG